MNRKRICLAAGTAFTLALLASLVAYKYLADRSRAAEQAKPETVGIVVAVVDISMGSTIRPNQVAATPWPKNNLPFDAFRDPRGVVGRMTRREFLKGEPIVESKLLPTDKNSGITALKVREESHGIAPGESFEVLTRRTLDAEMGETIARRPRE